MNDYRLKEKNIDGIPHYYITFLDVHGVHTEEISEDVYAVIKESQTSEQSYARKGRRYGLCTFDETIGEHDVIDDSEGRLADEKILKEINRLTDVQKERLDKYYRQGMSIRKIAESEGASYSAVRESISEGIRHLKHKTFEKN